MRCSGASKTSEDLVKAIDPHCYLVDFFDGKFGVVCLDPTTIRDGHAEAILISTPCENRADAWAGALRYLEARA